MVDEMPVNPEEAAASSNHRSPKRFSVREGTENFYSGSEPFFAFFTQTQVILNTLRLTLDNQVVVSTSDLGSKMESARRSFQHSGNLVMVIQDVSRIAAMFRQRVQSWEREVQNRERNKHGMNGTLIQRIKAEIAHVRSRIHGIDRAVIKLEVKLHQMAGEAMDENQSKPETRGSENAPPKNSN